MLMPKATVHEDRLTPPDERQIWLAWQIFAVKTIAKAQTMGELPDEHLRLCALGPDRAHVGATAFRCQFVHCSVLIDMIVCLQQSSLVCVFRLIRNKLARSEVEAQLVHKRAIVLGI